MTKYGVELWWNEKGKKKALVIPKSKITTEISFFPETYQLGEENNSKIRENEQGHWINRLIQGDNFVIMQQLLDEGFTLIHHFSREMTPFTRFSRKIIREK